jgi:hypothetical protein
LIRANYATDGTIACFSRFSGINRRIQMKRIACLVAAVSAMTILGPLTANAQDVRIRVGDDRGYVRHHDHGFRDSRAEYFAGHDRGWHRGWRNRDRTVIIKERRRRHWD